jgi:hypothetical protein
MLSQNPSLLHLKMAEYLGAICKNLGQVRVYAAVLAPVKLNLPFLNHCSDKRKVQRA